MKAICERVSGLDVGQATVVATVLVGGSPRTSAWRSRGPRPMEPSSAGRTVPRDRSRPPGATMRRTELSKPGFLMWHILSFVLCC